MLGNAYAVREQELTKVWTPAALGDYAEYLLADLIGRGLALEVVVRAAQDCPREDEAGEYLDAIGLAVRAFVDDVREASARGRRAGMFTLEYGTDEDRDAPVDVGNIEKNETLKRIGGPLWEGTLPPRSFWGDIFSES